MEETIIKHISAEEFLKIDKSGITLLDIREEYEVQIKPIYSALNIPFSELTKRLSEVDKNKPVYVICSTGDLSEEINDPEFRKSHDEETEPHLRGGPALRPDRVCDRGQVGVELRAVDEFINTHQ